MAICPRCRWTYRDDLLSPLIGSEWHDPICAICAREDRARIHGVDIPFRPGTQAASMYASAVKWRQTHPEKGPK